MAAYQFWVIRVAAGAVKEVNPVAKVSHDCFVPKSNLTAPLL